MSTGSELVGGNASELFIVTMKKQIKVFCCIATWCLTAKCSQSHLHVNGRKLAHFEYPQKQHTYCLVLHDWCSVKLLPSVHTIQPSSMSHHFMQSHIRRAHVFGCNLPAALWAEWPGSFSCYCSNRWNGCWNKSQHGKLTLEKTILTPLLQGLEPTTFQSCVWHSNHWAIPVPISVLLVCM